MTKLACTWMVGAALIAFGACSDDDGANVTPNPPPGAGSGGGGNGGTTAGSGPVDAGPGGTSPGGTGGAAGSGGDGGSAGCVPVAAPDAGTDAGSPGVLDAGADASSDASAPIGVVSFAADIHPIFEASCGPCHVTDGSAGHNVGGEIDQAYEDAVQLGQTLVARIDGGGMPPSYADPPNNCGDEGGDQPGDPGCLSVGEVALVQAWINQCFPR